MCYILQASIAEKEGMNQQKKVVVEKQPTT